MANSIEPLISEREFLHELSGLVAAAVLYAGLIEESLNLTHLPELLRAHQDLDALIRGRRALLKGQHEPS